MRSLFRDFVERRRGPPHPSEQETGGLAPVLLVVGLGNPGAEHAHNRHNVGFWCLNRLAQRAHVDFRRRGKLTSIAQGDLAGRQIALGKPQTYVNNSGDAVSHLLREYRLQPKDLVVICDDLDRGVGMLRIRRNGGHGGHNGLRSIIAAIQSEDFARIRIGIGRPVVDGVPSRDPERVADYVLHDPPSAERRLLDSTVEMAAEAVLVLIEEGCEAAMRKFNGQRDTDNG
jgi:peptidyl-tRNA hydrolase, PTH1 family